MYSDQRNYRIRRGLKYCAIIFLFCLNKLKIAEHLFVYANRVFDNP